MSTHMADEIAATAARLIVEEGLEYGPAKRRAVKQLGLPSRTALPDNDEVEAAVRDYIAVFCADTQPAELQALRTLAAHWMHRLSAFQPYLTGAVWRGTATRWSDIHLNLYAYDSKSVEIALIDEGLAYDVSRLQGQVARQDTERLSLHVPCAPLQMTVGLHLSVLDHDDLRGALRPDAQGRTAQGNLKALQALLASDTVGGST